MTSSLDIAVVGAGVFGATAALELQRRGHRVTLLDPGPLPREQAASVDHSRLVRTDYGTDAFYVDLAEQALARWDDFTAGSEPVFFRDGFALLTRSEMVEGEFEHDSFTTLCARGQQLERLGPDEIVRRIPAFAGAGFCDGYVNPRGGCLFPGRVQIDRQRRIFEGPVCRQRPGKMRRFRRPRNRPGTNLCFFPRKGLDIGTTSLIHRIRQSGAMKHRTYRGGYRDRIGVR